MYRVMLKRKHLKTKRLWEFIKSLKLTLMTSQKKDLKQVVQNEITSNDDFDLIISLQWRVD